MATITVICCNCKKFLGTKEVSNLDQDGEISHGLCEECFKKLYPDFMD